MDKTSENMSFRDRTYRNKGNGEYLSQNQYMGVAVSLIFTHFLLEVMYIFLGCIPMAIINILSIISYAIGISFVRKNETTVTVWIMVIEVYLHVMFACTFMGINCGFQLWLFGSFTSIFLPFNKSDMSKKQKDQIGAFSLVIVISYVIITFLGSRKMLPTTFNPSEEVTKILYYVNAVMGFGSITLYANIYNGNMDDKNRELRLAADHDYLTGIYNRQRIQRILVAEVEREQELPENHLFIAILDIDYFKQVNDTYGHLAGDDVLKEITKFFERRSGDGLLYGRWGGEEFLLIAPDNITYDEFGEMLENLRKEVEKHVFISGKKKMDITVSIGSASFKKGMTVEKLVHEADARLYEAKNSGRNKVVIG